LGFLSAHFHHPAASSAGSADCPDGLRAETAGVTTISAKSAPHSKIMSRRIVPPFFVTAFSPMNRLRKDGTRVQRH
jgi:hypothetical protein